MGCVLGSPRRRNNITGVTLPDGDRYEGGALYGEATCGDYGGFTVDFDDRGIDGDPDDGTDWGKDDFNVKCALEDEGEAWFIWVRE